MTPVKSEESDLVIWANLKKLAKTKDIFWLKTDEQKEFHKKTKEARANGNRGIDPWHNGRDPWSKAMSSSRKTLLPKALELRPQDWVNKDTGDLVPCLKNLR